MGVLATVYRSTAKRIVRVVLIEPVILVQHRNSWCFNRRHIPKGIPHDLKVVIHFTAPTHEETFCHILASVAAAAGKLQFFKQMDMLPLHLSVTDKIESSSQPSQPRANNVSRFLIYILWFLWMSK